MQFKKQKAQLRSGIIVKEKPNKKPTQTNKPKTNQHPTKQNNTKTNNQTMKQITSEKVIKHPSSIPLNTLNSKLIILGSLALLDKDSGFPVSNRTATIQQDHSYQGENLQGAATALTQHEQVTILSSGQPAWNRFIITPLSIYLTRLFTFIYVFLFFSSNSLSQMYEVSSRMKRLLFFMFNMFECQLLPTGTLHPSVELSSCHSCQE